MFFKNSKNLPEEKGIAVSGTEAESAVAGIVGVPVGRLAAVVAGAAPAGVELVAVEPARTLAVAVAGVVSVVFGAAEGRPRFVVGQLVAVDAGVGPVGGVAAVGRRGWPWRRQLVRR